MAGDDMAFLATVVRFLAIHFDGSQQWSKQYASLRNQLREGDDDEPEKSGRLTWEVRRYRRVRFESLRGWISTPALAYPIAILDLSALGMRLRILEDATVEGTEAISRVAIVPPGRNGRIDIPVRVKSKLKDKSLGVEFTGPPLLVSQHPATPVSSQHDSAAPSTAYLLSTVHSTHRIRAATDSNNAA